VPLGRGLIIKPNRRSSGDQVMICVLPQWELQYWILGEISLNLCRLS